MRQTVSRIVGLFDKAGRRRALALLGFIVVTGLIETAGIVSIVPFLAVVASPDALAVNKTLRAVQLFLGVGDTREFLIWLGIFTIVALTASNGASALTARAIFRFTYRQGYQIGHRLLRNYLSRPYTFFLAHNTVDLGRNVYDEVPRVVNGVVLPAMQVVSKAISALMILLLLVLVDPILAAVVICTFAGAYYALRKFVQRRLARVRDVAHRSRAASFRLASEALSGIKELKVLGREEQCLNAYAAPAVAVADADASNQLLGTLPKYLLETLAFGGIVVVTLFLLARSESRMVVLPTLALYAFAGYRLLPALQQIYVNLNYVQYYSPSLDLLTAHLKEAGQDARVSAPSGRPERLPLRTCIEFDRVTFSYPTGQTPVLAGLTMRIDANAIVGIVGRTGGGKSTVLDILVGLLPPSSGELRVDGTALTSARLRAWQDNIGYVPQQIYLSDGTVKENIAFGAGQGEMDMDRVVEAAKTAQLHDFIVKELPQGYDTVVGERGVRLSGGQRQRIGTARALYRDPAVLVMDEATSALDNLTEVAIMASLRKFSCNKTVIIVAHRLTTLHLCDRIFVLAEGQVAAHGTYQELLACSDLFRQLDAMGRAAASDVG